MGDSTTNSGTDGDTPWWEVTYNILDPGGAVVDIETDRVQAASESDARSLAEESASYGRPTETCEVADITPDSAGDEGSH